MSAQSEYVDDQFWLEDGWMLLETLSEYLSCWWLNLHRHEL
jgi:hypothetical protein